MYIKNSVIQSIYDRAQKTNHKLDRSQIFSAVDNSIRIIQAEIVRVSSLSYKSWKNLDKIRSLDKQVEYLEEVLAAYEKDLKKT